MPKIDLDSLERTSRTGYPPPLDEPVRGRWYRRLGPPSGLTDFTASHVTLDPGAWSSQRHVHDTADEFLVMLDGEAVLIEDEGRTILRPGDCVAFPKGGTAHHLVNESTAPCHFVCVAAPDTGGAHYPDVDLDWPGPGKGYTARDGTPY